VFVGVIGSVVHGCVCGFSVYVNLLYFNDFNNMIPVNLIDCSVILYSAVCHLDSGESSLCLLS
jgi:hypothetical protein